MVRVRGRRAEIIHPIKGWCSLRDKMVISCSRTHCTHVSCECSLTTPVLA